MSFFGLLRRAVPADGASPSLEAGVTGFSPGAIETLAETEPVPTGRRAREADAGAAMLSDALGSKVLHGWLQNRHQTLMPLSLNLAVLSPEQRSGLASILATLLLAGRPTPDAAAFAPQLREWLAGLGGRDDVMARFDAAMEAPLSLDAVFETAQSLGLVVYTYVGALIVADPRFPVSAMMADLVRARFDIPTATARSAVRRYGR